MEWECCIKHPEDGAREGAKFINDHIIKVTEKAFDDFAGRGSDDEFNRKIGIVHQDRLARIVILNMLPVRR